MQTTVGQLLINDALPEDMRDHDRPLDKKSLSNLLSDLAKQHPEQYRDVSHKLSNLGWKVAQDTGGFSFGLRHLRKSAASTAFRTKAEQKIQGILDDDSLDDKKREELLVRAVGDQQKSQQEAVFQEAKAQDNPLAHQLAGAGRGNKMNLSSLLGSDMLYADHRGNVIPVPVLRSYSEGLRPWEYWAGSYGARKGVIDLKFATQDAGFLSKQLNQVAHRLVVVGNDHEHQGDGKDNMRGLPVEVDDPDNEGSLLAKDTGPYKRNTVLTPKILADLKNRGAGRLLVRSPIVGGSPEGGIYARDAGVREQGTLPGRGELPGLAAVQALSEPLTQAQISSKHTGGVAGEGKAISGFDTINQMIQVPKVFKGGAAHAEVDGPVGRIEDAPAGGKYVWIGGQRHYIHDKVTPSVKTGDRVEAGDTISEGWPNPAKVVEHKGIGEGRKYFVKAFGEAMAAAGINSNRRNVELLSRGLINHVRLTDEMGDYVPDDIVPYSTLEHLYEPRKDAKEVEPYLASNKYLEKPVLHYSIGTRVRPSVQKDLKEFGVKKVTVHDEPPPFKAEMVRGMYNLANDPDWMTRMYGSGLKGSLLDATHRGATSDEEGTSFVPSLSKAVDFGQAGLVHSPEPGLKVSDDEWSILDDVLLKESDATQDSGMSANFHMGTGAPASIKPPPAATPAPTPAPKPAAPAPAPSPASPPPAPAPAALSAPATATATPAPAPATPAQPAPAAPEPYKPQHFFSGYAPHSVANGQLLGAESPFIQKLGPLAPIAVMGNLDYSAVGSLIHGVTGDAKDDIELGKKLDDPNRWSHPQTPAVPSTAPAASSAAPVSSSATPIAPDAQEPVATTTGGGPTPPTASPVTPPVPAGTATGGTPANGGGTGQPGPKVPLSDPSAMSNPIVARAVTETESDPKVIAAFQSYHAIPDGDPQKGQAYNDYYKLIVDTFDSAKTKYVAIAQAQGQPLSAAMLGKAYTDDWRNHPGRRVASLPMELDAARAMIYNPVNRVAGRIYNAAAWTKNLFSAPEDAMRILPKATRAVEGAGSVARAGGLSRNLFALTRDTAGIGRGLNMFHKGLPYAAELVNQIGTPDEVSARNEDTDRNMVMPWETFQQNGMGLRSTLDTAGNPAFMGLQGVIARMFGDIVGDSRKATQDASIESGRPNGFRHPINTIQNWVSGTRKQINQAAYSSDLHPSLNPIKEFPAFAKAMGKETPSGISGAELTGNMWSDTAESGRRVTGLENGWNHPLNTAANWFTGQGSAAKGLAKDWYNDTIGKHDASNVNSALTSGHTYAPGKTDTADIQQRKQLAEQFRNAYDWATYQSNPGLHDPAAAAASNSQRMSPDAAQAYTKKNVQQNQILDSFVNGTIDAPTMRARMAQVHQAMGLKDPDAIRRYPMWNQAMTQSMNQTRDFGSLNLWPEKGVPYALNGPMLRVQKAYENGDIDAQQASAQVNGILQGVTK